MSDLDRQAALVALARARQAVFSDADQQVYLLGLEDISESGVIGACLSLLRQPRAEHGTTMPSVGDIRREVGRLARHIGAAPPPALAPHHGLQVTSDEHGPRYSCRECQDVGWVYQQCAGWPNHSCGRPQAKLRCYPHPYVTPCSCGARARKAS